MTLNAFLALNQYLAFWAFLLICYRTSSSWFHAHHRYQWHYRIALMLLATAIFLNGVGAIAAHHRHVPATFVSPCLTLFFLAVVAFTFRWPAPEEKEDSDAGQA